MSQFKQYKFTSRTIRTRCNQDKVTVSKEDFEELVHVANVSCEQAQQLQMIIENLQKIKADAVIKVLDKLSAEIEEYRSTIDYAISEDEFKIKGMKDAYDNCLETIDKCKAEQESKS